MTEKRFGGKGGGAASSPNILLITADQLRYDCMGYSGRYPVSTPSIDRLAADGVWFSNAFTHIPLCCPARQSLLNGRRPESFGALWNYSGALAVSALPPDAYSWPRELARSGYSTAFFGKWGVNPSYDATAFGYDTYTGEEHYKEFRQRLYPDVRFTNGFFGESNPIPVEHAETHWLADRAIERMRELQAAGRPWHIALHFADPHLPCRPSGRFADMYDPALVPEWAGFRETFAGKPYIQRQQLYNWGVEEYEWRDWAPIVARYYGMISQMDDAVGRVLQALDDSGGAGQTIVIFTADHGDMCGSHRMMDKHYILYDDVVHVPFIIRWPGGRENGGGGRDTGDSCRIAENSVSFDGKSNAVCGRFVYNLLDLPPTVLEAIGLETPDWFHGRSLLPLLNGESLDSGDWRNEAVATYNGQQFGLYTQRMIRTSEWKYIWNTTDVDELYHLTEDPAELQNEIHNRAHTELIRHLRHSLYTRLLNDGDGLVQNEWMRNQLLLGNKL